MPEVSVSSCSTLLCCAVMGMFACRFGVVQGTKSDGSVKVRAVDHFSWSCKYHKVCPSGNLHDAGLLCPFGFKECTISKQRKASSKKRKRLCSVNGSTVVPETIQHDHIDQLAVVLKGARERYGALPGIFKADVDAAYRRIPLDPAHRWAAAIAYRRGKDIMLAVHRACPFGSCSAVYNWERVGAMLCTMGRRILKLALLRYVDDFFAPERRGHVCLGAVPCVCARVCVGW